MKKFLLAGATAMAFTGSANAATIVFDFEGIDEGIYSTLSDTQGGLTLDLERAGGTDFEIVDLSPNPSTPAEYGERSLSPFTDISADPFVANFSSGVLSVSVDFGDFTPSDEDTLTLEIFDGLDGTGSSLGFATLDCCDVDGFPEFFTLDLASGTPILSAVFNGGSGSFPNSVFYDNITVETAMNNAIPEPATWAMLIAGFGLVGGALRRRKANVKVSYA